MEQKIIIGNNNLLFQFSDHNNNNLLVLELWKSTRSVIVFLIRCFEAKQLRYISSHVASSFHYFLSDFLGLFDSSGLVYTAKNCMLYFLIIEPLTA